MDDDRRDLLELVKETGGGVSPALIEASQATGGDLTRTVERMLRRQLGTHGTGG